MNLNDLGIHGLIGGGAPPNGLQDYTTPGTYTFTVPAKVKRITALIAAGGGGGGGGAAAGTGAGGGGGGSSNSCIEFTNVIPGQQIRVVVGVGGTGGTYGNPGGAGGAGGVSSVGSISVNGGLGGQGGNGPGNAAGGLTNTSNGTYKVAIRGYSASGNVHGIGASSIFGVGGGNRAAGTFGGGGGGSNFGDGTGGNGGNGRVTLVW